MATYKNLRKVLNLPTLSANPSSGVNGEMYFNTTDSALYIYDGAWKKATQSSTYSYQGTQTGFCVGGGSTETNQQGIISSFSLTSDGNATSVGNVAASDNYSWGATFNGGSNGYQAGGGTGSTNKRRVDKFSMTSPGASSNVATLSADQWRGGAGTAQTFGLSFGAVGTSGLNVIQTVTFATDGVASSSYSMSTKRAWPACGNNTTHTYLLGGYNAISGAAATSVEKFAHSNDANSVAYSGTISTGSHKQATGTSSTEKVFKAGGMDSSFSNQIESIAFASEANATDLGNLLSAINNGNLTGVSGEAHGYMCGGATYNYPSGTAINNIQKLAYANSNNATDVGNLTQTTQKARCCFI